MADDAASLDAEARERVTVERLASGGDGVARLADGCTVFVPFAAPGDVLDVRIVSRKARHAHAVVERVVSPGPDRREPACPVYGSCGGCTWQHLTYDAQLVAKREILGDALERIGRLAVPRPVTMHGSPHELGYRTRARVLAASGRAGFRRVQSHELEPVERCPVLDPRLEPALAEAGRLSERHGLPLEVELAVGGDGAVRAAPAAGTEGEPLELAIGADRLRISSGVFAQANGGLLAALVERVDTAAGAGARAAELFAGAGLFTLGLARRFGRVLAIEANARATTDLAFNLERAGRHRGAEIVTGPVEEALERVARFEPEVIVLDPPRSGLATVVRERLGYVRAGKIVYVSCDPATLARDLRDLAAAGYALERVDGFDLFPQTHHVEAVAVLSRQPRS